MNDQNRIQSIYTHPLYLQQLQAIRACEAQRIFCRHDEAHFLAVARLFYIKCMQQSLAVPRELGYAAAFLHDIGRAEQSMRGVPHEQASVSFAKQILPEAGFSDRETAFVCALIAGHRTEVQKRENAGILAGGDTMLTDAGQSVQMLQRCQRLFYEADKQSRSCFCCPAAAQCNWPPEKKNMEIGL